MAWHNGGNWEGLSLVHLPTIIAELCYAINEREQIIGRGTYLDAWSPWKEYYDLTGNASTSEALTVWPVANKTYPVAADFDGTTNAQLISILQSVIGSFSSLSHVIGAGFNVDILTKFSSHFQGDGAMAAYNTLLAIPLDRKTNTNIYLAMKEFLDNSVEAVWYFLPGAMGDNHYSCKTLRSGAEASTPTQAWALAYAAAGVSECTHGIVPNSLVNWSVEKVVWPSGAWTASIRDAPNLASQLWMTKYIKGTLIRGVCNCRTSNPPDKLDPAVIGTTYFLQFDGSITSWTHNGSSWISNGDTFPEDRGVSWPNVDGTNTVIGTTGATTTPATLPFKDISPIWPTGGVVTPFFSILDGSIQVSAQGQASYAITNISSLLTYG